ncbi:MAG: HMA2 domain-containing protein [Prochloraceae cyanobacterium]
MVIVNDANTPQLTQQLSANGARPICARLLSQTPGRVRLLLAPEFRQAEQMKRIASVLSERLEIYRVRTNVAVGSLTIFYPEEGSSWAQICSVLSDLGVIFPAQSSAMSLTQNQSQAAAVLSTEAATLNQSFFNATGGTVDLRFLMPLGLSALALRQLLVHGLQLGAIPWYVLGWYAFDSFVKFHPSSPSQLPIETHSEDLDTPA